VPGVLNRGCVRLAVLFAALLLVCGLPLRAHAQRTNVQRSNALRRFGFRIFPAASSRHTVPLVTTCPNNTNGALYSISVPVNQPLELTVEIDSPAPAGGIS